MLTKPMNTEVKYAVGILTAVFLGLLVPKLAGIGIVATWSWLWLSLAVWGVIGFALGEMNLAEAEKSNELLTNYSNLTSVATTPIATTAIVPSRRVKSCLSRSSSAARSSLVANLCVSNAIALMWNKNLSSLVVV